MLSTQADVVIVGGGIIGAATAYEAAKQGASVVVVEKDFVGAEQSSRNWGYTRQQGRHVAELELAVSALELWSGLSDELGEATSWTRSGNLIVDDGPGAATKFARWAAVGARAGVPVEVLDRDELSRVAPGLTGPWTAGLYTPNDGHADPVLAMAAYDKALRRVGVDVRTGCTAVSLITTFGAVVGVETTDGPVYGARVVVAAGTWSRRLLRTIGLRLPVQWVRSSVAATAPAEPGGIPPVWAPGCAFRQGIDGRVVFAPAGASDVDAMMSSLHDLTKFVPLWWQNLDMGLRPRIGGELIEDLRRGPSRTGRYNRGEPRANRARLAAAHARLGELVPAWSSTRIERTWAGYIDGTPDGLPVISTVPGCSGLILATGFSGHGYGLAPAVGRAVSALALDNDCQFQLEPFHIERFRKPSLIPAQKIH
jgi:glycine/D-amino acid oxidase-like deaminating enzyme